jgi:hypothetical protein
MRHSIFFWDTLNKITSWSVYFVWSNVIAHRESDVPSEQFHFIFLWIFQIILLFTREYCRPETKQKTSKLNCIYESMGPLLAADWSNIKLSHKASLILFPLRCACGNCNPLNRTHSHGDVLMACFLRSKERLHACKYISNIAPASVSGQVRFVIFTALNVKNTVLWVVTPCRLVEANWRFGENCILKSSASCGRIQQFPTLTVAASRPTLEETEWIVDPWLLSNNNYFFMCRIAQRPFRQLEWEERNSKTLKTKLKSKASCFCNNNSIIIYLHTNLII